MDAQPGADDRRQLPGEGPARGVAARCPGVHALAGRRRPALQPARLAVGRGIRHRSGAVLPGVQPDHPGREVRPDGTYVRRWVPELADVPTRFVHEPWKSPDGVPDGYPEPIVDHQQERREALARYERVTA